jgi:hypothetical protein
MTRIKAILTAVAAVALVLGPSVARAQYSTPLRYDLRYTSPTYIPSGTLRTGPPRQADPYRFGNPLHGNLGVTGNLRLGKSFRGNVPYVRSGSQLAQPLPSTALSTFRRDSFGVQDLGTPLQYGQTEAFFPDTATVTTPWAAGQRFNTQRFRDRARYLPPNYSQAPSQSLQEPTNIFSGPGGWTGLRLEDAEVGAGGGYAVVQPQTTDEVLQSLRELSRPYTPPEERAEGEPAEGEGAGAAYPYDIFETQFDDTPMNLFGVEPARKRAQPESDYERSMKLRYAPETTDLDRWVEPMTADGEPRERTAEPGADDQSAADRWGAGAWPDPGEADADEPWAALETPETAAEVDGLPGGALPSPRPSFPREPTSGYGQYVLRGHEAMRQKEFGKAESLYAAAAALERDRPAAFFGRVHALLASRVYLQAASVLERGLASHPEWVSNAPDLEAVYPDQDVYTRIRRNLEREINRGSTRGGYRLLMAYVELAVGNPEAARSHLEQLAEPGKAAKAMLEALGPE